VTRILIAADGAWVVDEVTAAVAGPDTEVVAVTRGLAVLPWLEENEADLIVLDLQIGNMGGMAVCQELRLEEGAGRRDRRPVLMLLDRRADVFLARRVDAEGWLIKPLDPIRLRRALTALLAGGTYYDSSFAPDPVLAPPLA
jgi:DNA-binding response OmpR family regulator